MSVKSKNKEDNEMKVLLSIISDVTDLEALHAVYEKFYNHGYKIEQFDNSNGEIQIDSLPILLDQICNKSDYLQHKVEFVIISNIKLLLFSWFRCYNALVADYIYFLENKTISTLSKLDHQTFLTRLSNFYGIDRETVQGKIYINLNDNNYNVISRFLMSNYNFRFFDLLDNYNYSYLLPKTLLNKSYVIDQVEYDLSYNPDGEKEKHTLQMEKAKFDFNQHFINLIFNKHAYYIYYFILTVYNAKDFNVLVKNKLLVSMFHEMDLLNDADKACILGSLRDYLNDKDSSFFTNVYFLSLLVLIHKKPDMLREMMNLLKQDQEYTEYHYPLLMNTLFYISKCGLSKYPEMYNDRMQILEDISNYYKSKLPKKTFKNLDNKKASNAKPKKIAIIAGQLLSLKHSPTLVVLNRAKNLKKYNDCEVKIFVDDIFVYAQDEVIFPHVFASAPSSSIEKLHKDFLGKENVAIYYAKTDCSRTSRVVDFVKKVNEYDPDVIYNLGNDYGIPNTLLSGYYPIISQRIGDMPITKWSNLYLGPDLDFDAFNMERQCLYLKPDTYFDEFSSATHQKERSLYNLDQDDFVMVTVGNRLDVDLSSDAFLECLLSFMDRHEKAKWLLVGSQHDAHIKTKLQHYEEQNRVVRVDYENELEALYGICNVFINPPRSGGGFSGLLAMKLGLPILSIKGDYDISNYIGQENAVADFNEYERMLEKLYQDHDYRAYLSTVLTEKYSQRSNNKKAVQSLIGYFKQTIEIFYGKS